MTDIVNIFDAGDPRTDDAGVRIAKLVAAMHMSPLGNQWPRRKSPNMSASLIGRSGSSAFRLSTTTVSMSLTGSCFSSESAPRPFHHGISKTRWNNLLGGLAKRQVQTDIRSHLIHPPVRDILPPLSGIRGSSYRI